MDFPKEQVYNFLTFMSTDQPGRISEEYTIYKDVLKLFLDLDPRILDYYGHFIEVVIMPYNYKFCSVLDLIKIIYEVKTSQTCSNREYFLAYNIWGIIWH